MGESFDYLQTLPDDPGNLIRGLQLIQAREGYVSDDAVRAAGSYFHRSPVEVEGVLTFYTQFKRVKPGRFKIAVCDGTACHIKGSVLIREWVRQAIGIGPGETDAEGRFSVESVACLGCCSLAPVMSINGRVYGKLDRKELNRILKEYKSK